MTKRKWIVATLWIISTNAYTQNSSTGNQQNPTETEQSEDCKQNQPEDSNILDQVVDAIVDAACNQHDYGKDIGDR